MFPDDPSGTVTDWMTLLSSNLTSVSVITTVSGVQAGFTVGVGAAVGVGVGGTQPLSSS